MRKGATKAKPYEMNVGIFTPIPNPANNFNRCGTRHFVDAGQFCMRRLSNPNRLRARNAQLVNHLYGVKEGQQIAPCWLDTDKDIVQSAMDRFAKRRDFDRCRGSPRAL
jgi:hypothetical protein